MDLTSSTAMSIIDEDSSDLIGPIAFELEKPNLNIKHVQVLK